MIIPPNEPPVVLYVSWLARLVLAIAVSVVFAAPLPLWQAAPLTVGLLLAAVPWTEDL